MALSDEVVARYSAQRLLNLTNPDNPAATSNNATTLAAACTDAAADFKILAGVVFDVTDARHVSVAVRGVIAYLYQYMDNAAKAPAMADFHYRLKDLAKVTGRDRLLPQTSSHLQPTVPGSDGRQARPAFDDASFTGGQLQPPYQAGQTAWNNADDDESI